MKIGIFTYHSQINYGGVLQAYALQQTLMRMGHQACIVDRWLLEKNRSLVGTFPESTFLGKCKRLLYAILGNGEGAEMLRRYRTSTFIRDNLNLTPYHFIDWKDAPKSLSDFNCFIVGSDQVWNFHCPDNFFYLLEKCSDVPKISYAASMGGNVEQFSNDAKRIKDGLKEFKDISVREKTAQRFISNLGLMSEHVVDPTLLAPREIWGRFQEKRECHRRLFCYFMEDSLKEVFPVLSHYAAETGSDVDIFFNDFSQFAVKFSSEYGYLHEWWRLQKAKLWPQIHLHLGAGPVEFVKYASMATDAVSDSFHALMFSIIFNLNVRILMPKSDYRTQMFARIREFTHKITSGELEMDSLDSALSSIQGNTPVLFARESIEKQRQKSMKWLTQALVTVMSDVNH